MSAVVAVVESNTSASGVWASARTVAAGYNNKAGEDWVPLSLDNVLVVKEIEDFCTASQHALRCDSELCYFGPAFEVRAFSPDEVTGLWIASCVLCDPMD